jgi:hypothetical protein
VSYEAGNTVYHKILSYAFYFEVGRAIFKFRIRRKVPSGISE